MKHRASIILAAVLILTLTACGKPAAGDKETITAEPPSTAAPEAMAVYSPSPSPDTDLTPTPSETPEAESNEYVLSFAGDCTLASEHNSRNDQYGFVKVVGDDFEYAFKAASEYFENDDFTIVNLECALTNYNSPADKMFRFKGDPSYVQMLTTAGIECVNVANNHSHDYGETGFSDTKKILEDNGIACSTDGGTCLYTTERSLKVGVIGVFYTYDGLAYKISQLRSQGADIVIVSAHWGVEGSYRYTYDQEKWAKFAIDNGADIVFGHHPHVLQQIVKYGDGVIMYSMGNFVFGGNTNPRDKDTAVVQQYVIKNADGSYSLGETKIIPFSLSGKDSSNDYSPVPLTESSERYARVLSKLDGSFDGADLYVSYNHPEDEPEATEQPPVTEQTETPPAGSEAPTEGETGSEPPAEESQAGGGEEPTDGQENGEGEQGTEAQPEAGSAPEISETPSETASEGGQ